MRWPSQDDLDYIFVSTLDSNIDVRKDKSPKADAELDKLNPAPRR